MRKRSVQGQVAAVLGAVAAFSLGSGTAAAQGAMMPQQAGLPMTLAVQPGSQVTFTAPDGTQVTSQLSGFATNLIDIAVNVQAALAGEDIVGSLMPSELVLAGTPVMIAGRDTGTICTGLDTRNIPRGMITVNALGGMVDVQAMLNNIIRFTGDAGLGQAPFSISFDAKTMAGLGDLLMAVNDPNTLPIDVTIPIDAMVDLGDAGTFKLSGTIMLSTGMANLMDPNIAACRAR